MQPKKLQNIEKIILGKLITSQDYNSKIVSFLKPEYFEDRSDKVLFEEIHKYSTPYKSLPSIDALSIAIQDLNGLNDDVYQGCLEQLETFANEKPEEIDFEWLTDSTEQFAKDRSLYLAIMESISIMDDEDGERSPDGIPEMLSEALSVTLTSSLGHDYIEDAADRYEFYTNVENRLPFNLHYLDEITKGGLPDKTLNVLMATTGGGKTIFKCHMAAEYLKQGKNVMFFTMEMAAERIAERIDANMMKVKVDDIVNMGASTFIKKIDGIKSKTQGRLMIKEYPSTGAHSSHFRHFIRELKIKKKFEPDVIIVDYLNICASARVKSDSNSYTIIKAVAEELRGLGQEFGCRVWTSAQSNRGGYGNSELDLENVSESMGISHTADLFLALISNEELDAQGQIIIKQLKNRYGPMDFHRRFVLGLDKSKMTFYDIKDQGNIQSHTAVMKEDKPVFDNTKFGKKEAKTNAGKQSKQFTF